MVSIPDVDLRRELTATELVRVLRDIPTRDFRPEVVKQELAGVSVRPSSLERYLHWDPKAYTRNQIYRDDTFELLALCWEAGTVSPIHNHAQQDCWMHVHRGALCLEGFELEDPAHRGQVGDGIIVRRTERTPRAGEGAVDHRGVNNEIHRVINCRSFGSRAVSLHVYAKPFDTCIVYETRHKRARRLDLSYHSIEGRLVA